ncbi:MAG: TolC family protein [Deltaproteobacteria bacterium]|nr:TolC family protein [Deltaproteobacteria bacterium]
MSVLLLAGLATPLRAAELPASLDQAWQRALRGHPSLQAALGRLDSARAQIGSARNAWLPTASIDANHSQTLAAQAAAPAAVSSGKSSDSFSFTPAFQVSGSARWVAYDFGKTAASVEAAEKSAAAVERDVAAVRAQLWQGVASTWLAVLGADAALEVVRAGRDQLARSRDAIAQQVALRAKPDIDRLKVQADLAAAEGDVLRAEEVARAQRQVLAVAMGERRLPAGTLVEPAFDLGDAATVTLDDDAAIDGLLGQAVERRPEFAALRERVAALQAQLLAVQRTTRPSLYVSGIAQGSGTSASDLQTHVAGTVGVSLPLSALWTSSPQVLDTKGQIAAQIANRDNQVLALRGQLVTALSAWLQAKKRFPVAQLQVEFAQAARDAARQRYQVGSGLWLEVADAETAVVRAQLAAVQARLDQKSAEAQLLVLLGRAGL